MAEKRAAGLIIAEATSADIAAMHRIRMVVRENILSDPARVKPSDYERMMTNNRGKAWVGKVDGTIRGFSFADLQKRNLWALFIEPGFEGRGLGRLLHERAVGWLFENGAPTVWLTTDPGTRARTFYDRAGWRETGIDASGECRLEIDRESWNSRKQESAQRRLTP
jgi:GNAT superfamily N-acetyltransferase